MCNNEVKAIMKKIYSFLFAATALFAASSCQKEVAPEVEAPEFEKITFTASTEVDTKTALHENGKSTIWVAGDQISVFDANKEGNNRCFNINIDELSEDAKTATFSYEGDFVKDNTQPDPTVVALYPYQAKAYCDFFYYDRNYITGLNFPAEQTAVAGGFDPKAGFALGLGTMGTMKIGFQNLYALLKFTVRDAGVKKVTVKVDGENAFIAGDAKIQMTLKTEKIGSTEPVFESPVLSIVENGSNTVTLSCETGFDTEATYYIAVVPTTFTGISLYCDDVLVNEKNATMTLEANKIYNLKDNGSPKKGRGLAFDAAEYTATLGKEFTSPQVKGITEGVEYISSNATVATVDSKTGAVTLNAAGTATITAKAPESRNYLAGEASYTLTVKESAVIRVNNMNGWANLNITIKDGTTTLANAAAMVNEGNNVFSYELDPKYIGKSVSYYITYDWYQTSTKTTTLAAKSAATAINLNTTYLQPGTWDQGSATFGAWMWGTGVTDKMVTGVKVKNDFFEFEIPAAGYKNVIFLRCNNNNATADWSRVWNQTQDLTLKHMCFCVNSWTQSDLTDARWF